MTDSTATALQEINPGVAGRYKSVQAQMAHVTPATAIRWRAIVLEMASAGWHTWEGADGYLACSELVLAQFGERTLIAYGELGLGFCQYSHDPAKVWFEVVAALLGKDRADHLELIQTSAEVVRVRFPQASGLVCDVLLASRGIAASHSLRTASAWHSLVRDIAGSERQHLASFVSASNALDHVDWVEVQQSTSSSVYTTLAYLARLPELDAAFGPAVVTAIAGTVQRLAAEGISPLLEALLAHCTDLTPSQMLALLDHIGSLGNVQLVVTLLASVRHLPMDRPAIVGLWVEAGLRERGAAAHTAWFALESGRSTEYLQQLLGEVHLDDCQRVLQLYCEGLTGTRLRLVASADDGLPRTEGVNLLLPERVGVSNDHAGNYRFLKVALDHQLGFFEFGTARLERGTVKAWFESFANPFLARSLYIVLEEARIDWRVKARYPGIAREMAIVQADAQNVRPRPALLDDAGALIEILVQVSLGSDLESIEVPEGLGQAAHALFDAIAPLALATAGTQTTFEVAGLCLSIIEPLAGHRGSYLPRPVAYRGTFDPAQLELTVRLMDIEERLEDFIDSDDLASLSSLINPKGADVEKLEQGDIDDAMGEFLTELEDAVTEGRLDKDEVEEGLDNLRERVGAPPPERHEGTAYYYDEWDVEISDYRRRWCTLFEVTDLVEDPAYVEDTIAEHAVVAGKVKRQLRMLRPEQQRKVKGVSEGEELDLERTIEALVDRKSGRTPSEDIYVQRQKKDRDVAALFLVDMSASTDDRIPNDNEEVIKAPGPDEFRDEVLDSYYRRLDARDNARKRIIDIEKQAVVLMANALEGLGDNYAISGFSGYGRDRVEYFLCKSFDEPWGYAAKGRLGGLKPCRSTRMGPAIRHATRSLAGTESRVKALIIISDGYPQDFDYGHDRNDRRYGIADTTRALAEARERGIQTFCLTIDQSGHDYLREMCPDQQYMVIREVHDLPNQLSKVYQSLTS